MEMAVYVIGQLDIHDRDEYGKYETGFFDVFNKYQGEFLVVNERPEVLEGEWAHTRTVVIRFPSSEEAKRWWNSPEYQSLAEHRRRGSEGDIILVDGLPTS
jgi:uncharacterized protein (DUF1330 family)